MLIGIFVINDAINFAAALLAKGANILDILKIFILGIPASFVFILPVSFLIGWVISISRLSGDSEILAIQTSGVNPRTILKPVVFSGVLLSIFMLYSNSILSPQSAGKMDKTIKKVISKNLIKLKSRTFEKFGNFIFYVGRVNASKLSEVRVYKLERNVPEMVVFAKSGEVKENLSSSISFFLRDGFVILNNSGDKRKVITARFGEYSFSPVTALGVSGYHKLVQMTSAELRRMIKDYKSKKIPARIPEVELYLRDSLAFSGLFLAILGGVLATKVKSPKKVVGVGVSLLIIFFYWFLFTVMIHLAENGWILPWLACWIPNAVFLAAAGVLL